MTIIHPTFNLPRNFLMTVLILTSLAPGVSVTAEMPFASRTTILSSFDGASSVISLDIDLDGDLDVVAASRWDGTVHWFENPSWDLHVVASGFTEAYDLCSADFNEDGWPDLAGAARLDTNHNVVWWENPGPGVGGLWSEEDVSGTFLEKALSVDAGDIDGDGHVDLVVAGYHASVSGTFAWFRNRSGTGLIWDAYDMGTGYSSPHSVAVADVDGDYRLDVLGASYGDDFVLWFENDGTIISADPWPVNLIRSGVDGAISVRGSDMDRDGDTDVVVAAYDDNDLRWYENSGNNPPTFSQHFIHSSFTGAYSAEPVDLDRDGDMDVVATSRVDNDVTWWERSGSSWLERTLDTSFGGARAAVASDLDGDGDYEVVAVGDTVDRVAYWNNRNAHRNAQYANSTLVGLGDSPYRGVGVLDANHDGKLDVVVAASNESEADDLIVYLQGNSSALWTPQTIETDLGGISSLQVGDFNGSGRSDLLVAAAADDKIVWYGATPAGNFGVQTIATGFMGAADAKVADIDGDGDFDVVGAAEISGLLRWFEHYPSSGGAWTERVFASEPGASALAIGDLDGDLDPDVVVVSASSGELNWYENLGPAGPNWLWTPHYLTTALTAPRTVVVADMSGDGRPDIMAAGSTGSPTVSYWRNLGGSPPTWSLSTIPGPSGSTDGIAHLVAEDFDLDGDLDLAGVMNGDQRVIQWRNSGDGSALGWHMVAFLSGTMEPWAMATGDIDGDGDPDAVIAGDSRAVFARNRGGQYRMSGTPVAEGSVAEGSQITLFEISPWHWGRTGDLAFELEWINLGFENSLGDPLSEAEINAVIDRIYLFHDFNENGVLEVGVDPLLVVDSYLSAVSPGYVQLPVPHGQANPPIEPSQSTDFFLVADSTGDAASATTPCVRTVIKAGGTVTPLRYDLYDIDPRPAYYLDIDGGLICATASLFSDGFESGDTSAWSSSSL